MASIDYESCDENFDVPCDVHFNTASFPNEGIWVVSKGTATDAIQVIDQFTSLGRGTAFLTKGPFAGDLIAAGHTFEPGTVPEWNRIIRVPMSSSGGPELFTDLSVNNPDLGEQKPVGLAVNSKGEVFVSVIEIERVGDLLLITGGKILRLNSSGGYNLSDVFFVTDLLVPQFIAFDMEDNLYVSDASVGVWKITPDGNKTVISNSPGSGIEVE